MRAQATSGPSSSRAASSGVSDQALAIRLMAFEITPIAFGWVMRPSASTTLVGLSFALRSIIISLVQHRHGDRRLRARDTALDRPQAESGTVGCPLEQRENCRRGLVRQSVGLRLPDRGILQMLPARTGQVQWRAAAQKRRGQALGRVGGQHPADQRHVEADLKVRAGPCRRCRSPK